MGMMEKKVTDTTWGQLITGLMIFDTAKKGLEWYYRRKLPPDTTDSVLDKGSWYGYTLGMDDYEQMIILDLKMTKELGHTPRGGWDQYRKYEPILKHIQVKPEKMNYSTGEWPGWMLIPPAIPRDSSGYLLDKFGDRIPGQINPPRLTPKKAKGTHFLVKLFIGVVIAYAVAGVIVLVAN